MPEKQHEPDRDSAELTTRQALQEAGGPQVGDTMVRSGWPDPVTVVSRPHPLVKPVGYRHGITIHTTVDTLVQISHGGDTPWVSVDDLYTEDEAKRLGLIPGDAPVSFGQGEYRRDYWPELSDQPEPASTPAVRTAASFVAGVAVGVTGLVLLTMFA